MEEWLHLVIRFFKNEETSMAFVGQFSVSLVEADSGYDVIPS